MIAAEKRNKWIELLLKDYDELHFVKEDGSLDLTTNVTRITNKTKDNYPIALNNTLQKFDDFVIFPFDYFCAKNWINGVVKKTDNTYTVHHFSGSWEPKHKRMLKKVINKIISNDNVYKNLRELKRNIWG